jgi:hypothetical protein
MSEGRKQAARKSFEDAIKKEEAQRRGSGIITVLSDLDWYLSLELDEERPLDEKKITTNQRLFQIIKGVEFGTLVHASVLFGLSASVGLVLFSMHVKNPLVINIAWFYVLGMSLALKIGVAYWLIDRYYIFPRGITYTYLANFLGGYSIGLFIPEFSMFLFTLFMILVFYIIKSAHYSNVVIRFIERYFPHLTEPKFIPINLISIALCFAPYFMLIRRRKKSSYETKFLPLDYIPKEDE